MSNPSHGRASMAPLPPQSAYIVQYIRAWRLLLRLERRTWPDFNAAVMAAADYEVDLYSFFVVCWHVLDWVKNDATIPRAVRTAVEKAALASPVLCLCHDMANGSKHYVLESPKAPGVRPGTIDLERREDAPESKLSFLVVLQDGTVRPAHELAREALGAWRDVLDANGLPAPKLL